MWNESSGMAGMYHGGGKSQRPFPFKGEVRRGMGVILNATVFMKRTTYDLYEREETLKPFTIS